MTDQEHHRVPKLCGADIELGNFILAAEPVAGSCSIAARAILAEIDGISRGSSNCASSDSYQDWGRKFLLQGGCAYIDMDHLELALPECISAFDHVAAWHAMLRIAQTALARANEKQPADHRIQAIANNSDGQNSSFGSHLNFLVTRKTYDDIFTRKIQPMLLLAAYQASSIVFTGAGKVGSENGAPAAAYQISQRADFVETVLGPQTTYRRPLINSRDEPLTGKAGYAGSSFEPALARLHVIYADNTLCHVSSLLKVAVYQILLTQIEAGHCPTALLLDDPVDAIHCWSHDPTLQARARTATGQWVTAVEHQLLFLEQAKSFAERHGYEACVPRAEQILRLYEDTLLKLQQGQFSALTGRLDWVLKLLILERAMNLDSKLDWPSPEIKHLDHIYASLDPREGLYWHYDRAGLIQYVVSEDNIARFVQHAPHDTRAWTRAMLLRCAAKAGLEVDDVDWDQIRFRIPNGYPGHRRIDLGNPLSFTREQVEPLFRHARNLTELFDSLDDLAQCGTADAGELHATNPPEARHV